MKNKIKVIKKINNLVEKYDGSWMGGNAHIAFILSIGAGSCNENQRYNVQKSAIDWFYKQNVLDMRNLSSELKNVYPFKWQNKLLFNMVDSLHEYNDMFEALCLHWKVTPDWRSSLEDLFFRCGAGHKGTKVLWLFARDFLNIPAFAIDKSVKKTLEDYKLPVDPWEMTELCLEADIDPNILNREMFMGVNPDWSQYRPSSSLFI